MAGSNAEPVTCSSSQGMKVLAMFSHIRGGYARQLLRVLERAKEHGWEINVLCRSVDRKTFAPIVAPSGKIFNYPEMLNPIAWETDPARVADVERRLAEAEQTAGVPVGQLIAGCPASIGRAYVVPARIRLSSQMADRVLTNNTEPFRIFRRYFGFGEQVLAECGADVLLAFEWGTPLHSAMWLSATRQGIPAIALRRSKILTDFCYWSTDRLMRNTRSQAEARKRRNSDAAASDFAGDYIKRFRDQPTISNVVETKWKRKAQIRWAREAKAWLTLPVRFARAVALDLLYKLRGLDTAQRSPALERLLAPRMRAITARKHARYLRTYDDAQLSRMKYVYFPVHKETDMPLAYEATPWQDQRNSIQLIASSLPFGYNLLVREHKLNFGQRPKDYYPHLWRLPNVIVIDPYDSQFKYLRHADLIVTENGSSGWEGLLFRRKVLTIAPNFYDGAGLSERVYDANQLGARIVEMLARPAASDMAESDAEYDRQLAHMIDAEAATTFSNDIEGMATGTELLAELVKELRSQKSGRCLAEGAERDGVGKPAMAQAESKGLRVEV